ncbi:MAG: DUF1428 domain-containing protein [Planctomycetes bacterium]|nr:DUF1428 domain-containing protein [Planctomycetota bacterium]
MTYVDGYVIPVPQRRLASYKKMAMLGRKLWMKHGALQYFECVADDLAVQPGCGLGFTKLAKLKRGETLLYSFVVYRNRAHRNAVNKKVFEEMSQHKMPKVLPFDMKRMASGGFRTIVQG